MPPSLSALPLLLGRLLGLSVSRADLAFRGCAERYCHRRRGVHRLRWIIGTAVMVTLKALFPDLALEQAQDFGFKTVYGGERVLAFIALVIMAPVVEELLFRGLLYGKMRAPLGHERRHLDADREPVVRAGAYAAECRYRCVYSQYHPLSGARIYRQYRHVHRDSHDEERAGILRIVHRG